MQFRIADTFIDSLARLPDQDQKAVKTTAFDLQVNPSNPGMQFHKLDRARDQNFWSVRVSEDLRLIVHRTKASLLLCYVGHHDNAYHWAERRKLEIHPMTGAAQIVEVRETVREITIPKYVEAAQTVPFKPLLFAGMAAEELMSYGVPVEWLADVINADEDSLLEVADHLPGEAAEALLNLATGATPRINITDIDTSESLISYSMVSRNQMSDIPVAVMSDNAFDHPDAQRRFRVIHDEAELERALEYPWEKWIVFLHPAQLHLVERDFNGPARISGSAGTGKTIVALHRAVFLARNNPDARVLLTTFSNTLANALKTKLWRLIGNEPRLVERLEVHALPEIGLRLHELNLGHPHIASRSMIEQILEEAAWKVSGHKFFPHFILAEWEDVVDAW